VSGEGDENPEDAAVQTPRMPPELLKALTDCVAAFQDCTTQLGMLRGELGAHTEIEATRYGELREMVVSIEGKVDACDAGIKGLRLLIDKDYSSLRTELAGIRTQLGGVKELAASAYDIGESLTRKLKQAGIINGDETRRQQRAGDR